MHAHGVVVAQHEADHPVAVEVEQHVLPVHLGLAAVAQETGPRLDDDDDGVDDRSASEKSTSVVDTDRWVAGLAQPSRAPEQAAGGRHGAGEVRRRDDQRVGDLAAGAVVLPELDSTSLLPGGIDPSARPLG